MCVGVCSVPENFYRKVDFSIILCNLIEMKMALSSLYDMPHIAFKALCSEQIVAPPRSELPYTLIVGHGMQMDGLPVLYFEFFLKSQKTKSMEEVVF